MHSHGNKIHMEVFVFGRVHKIKCYTYVAITVHNTRNQRAGDDDRCTKLINMDVTRRVASHCLSLFGQTRHKYISVFSRQFFPFFFCFVWLPITFPLHKIMHTIIIIIGGVFGKKYSLTILQTKRRNTQQY